MDAHVLANPMAPEVDVMACNSGGLEAQGDGVHMAHLFFDMTLRRFQVCWASADNPPLLLLQKGFNTMSAC